MKVAEIRHLIRALHCGDDADVDWDCAIAAANQAFLTPQLHEAIVTRGADSTAPADARDYLKYIHGLNCERNVKLFAQLLELVRCLNDAGVVPILSKGAAELWTHDAATPRMMFDLDITVSTDELKRADDCFKGLDYASLPGIGYARGADVGAIDIHFPPGRFPEYWPRRDLLKAQSMVVIRRGASARILSDTLTFTHLVVHDMIKDGGWWHGRIDLRALLGLKSLVAAGHIEWDVAHQILWTPFARDCLASEMLTLRTLFDVAGPEAEASPMARRHHAKRMRRIGPDGASGAHARLSDASWSIRQITVKFRSRRAAMQTLSSAARKMLRS